MLRSSVRLAALALLLLPTLAGGCGGGGSGGDGAQLFLVSCAPCHGGDARGTTRGPDLVTQAAGLGVEQVTDVILDGEGLMDPVDLSIEEAEAVAAFVVERWLASD